MLLQLCWFSTLHRADGCPRRDDLNLVTMLAHTHTHIYIQIYMYMHACIHVCLYVYICICVCVHICMYVCVCMYVCAYTHGCCSDSSADVNGSKGFVCSVIKVFCYAPFCYCSCVDIMLRVLIFTWLRSGHFR